MLPTFIAAWQPFESDFLSWLVMMAIAIPTWLYLSATKPPPKGTAVDENGRRPGLSDEGGPVRSYGGGGGYGGGSNSNGGNYSDFMDDGE